MFKGHSRRYRIKGDRKPSNFTPGDLFLFPSGETALVLEVWDSSPESKYGPQWCLRFHWTPGRQGSEIAKHRWNDESHGALRTNMFNQLSIRGGNHLIPAKIT